MPNLFEFAASAPTPQVNVSVPAPTINVGAPTINLPPATIHVPQPVVNVPAPTVNNITTGSWQQPAAVIGAAILAAVLVHYFTQRRERLQKLREGYGGFSSAAYSFIEREKKQAALERMAVVADNLAEKWTNELTTARTRHAKATLLTKLKKLSKKNKELKQKSEEVYAKMDDHKDDALKAYSSLILMLGSDNRRIQSVEKAFARLEKKKYREYLGETKPLPSTYVKPKNANGNLAASLPARDQFAVAENMIVDLSHWVKEQSRDLAHG